MNSFFEIIHRDPGTRARTGVITTPHGAVETPSYVIVGTDAAVRCLEPEDIPETKMQMIIANTYHLWRQWGDEGLAEFPGLHKEMGWQGTIMTDSGGFQVFSLGAAREHRTGKFAKDETNDFRGGASMVRVTDSGVYFEDAGKELYLDAELSMRIQEQLGADIIFAFDEPSSPHHDYEYTKKTVARTHAWAERSLASRNPTQFIYGIVQGGAFEDLRCLSAQVIGALPFDGLAIGGSFGSSFGSTAAESMRELQWTVPLLPEERPRHLLGMGKIEDLFYGIEQGIDTFDCVIPTREARHGALWTNTGRFDVSREKNMNDGPIEEGCGCLACSGEAAISRRELRDLFRQKDARGGLPDGAGHWQADLPAITFGSGRWQAGRLATIHNVYFFNHLMEEIRNALREGRFSEYKRLYLQKFRAVL